MFVLFCRELVANGIHRSILIVVVYNLFSFLVTFLVEYDINFLCDKFSHKNVIFKYL